MVIETHGRIRMENNGQFWSIIEKATLSGSFDHVPRKVLNVGSKRYITSKFNKLKSSERYLVDRKYWQIDVVVG